jgi:putative ATP-dependent endonuclease of OLD family
MLITQVKLEGFRNFKNATINLTKKSLIIGSNEIGKSNLLHALRILLDRTLSLADVEPQDSDFYVYEDTNEIRIQLKFEGVCEECVVAKLREHVSDEGVMYLAYHATRDPNSKRKTYRFLVGRSPETLTDIESNRFYLRVLNLKFIGSKRDLFSYIRRERRSLLQDAKGERTEEQIGEDNEMLGQIESKLDEVHESVSSLSYIGKATQSINTELEQLSIKNVGQDVIFDTGASDPSQFVDNLRLATRVGEKTLAVGGDGRNNQIHLALWAARNRPMFETDEEPLEVSIFCIEEPESHLHPHQKRKLAGYLSDTLQAQVIITTHSPQIICGFPPASVIRLYDSKPDTLAAGNGSSPFIEQAFIEFGYRLNIIPAEAFFSSVALLVEGPSEELFFKALAEKIGVDLDRLNISVLMVDGVGFEPYISLFHSLKIDFVVRTDNDIFKVPQKNEYRFAGVQRGVNIYRTYFEKDEDFEEILSDHEKNLQGFDTRQPPQENLGSAQRIIEKLEDFNIYLAGVDLENDLKDSEISDALSQFFDQIGEDEIIAEMQKRKATFMFDFLRRHSDSLVRLRDNALAKPLLRCEQIASFNYDA